jgi:uncharacterized protein YegL
VPQILPFYVVCDESYSMDGAPIDALNQALPELHQAIGMDPTVSDKAYFSLIGFSDSAKVLLPLSDLGQITEMPELAADNGTSFSSAFTLLRSCVEQDVAALKQSPGNQVYRPVVFFMSDGQPNPGDNWQRSHSELVGEGFRYHPTIISFGIGTCDRAVISQVATLRAFIQEDGGMSPATALREFVSSMTRSIINSVNSVDSSGRTGMNLAIEDTVPGFTTVKADEL